MSAKTVFAIGAIGAIASQGDVALTAATATELYQYVQMFTYTYI